VWRHRPVSLNNEKNFCEISEDKIAFCEKTEGLGRGKFSDSNSACLKVLVPVKIFQFQDMLNESERYQYAANGLIALLGNGIFYSISRDHKQPIKRSEFNKVLYNTQYTCL
jgi:hypothetical protein